MLLSKMVGYSAASYGGASATGLTNLLIEVLCLTKRMQPVTCLPHQLLTDRVSPPKKLIHTISSTTQVFLIRVIIAGQLRYRHPQVLFQP